MAGTKQFEDLIAWQKARELARAVYHATRQPAFGQDLGLKRQIQRASVSVMSNIAEGYERGSQKEFSRFLAISKASCAEVRSLLYVAADAGYVPPPTFEDFMAKAEEASRIISGLRTSVQQHE
ncbi:MAG: four helix bundle protein [Phycisphaerales bacterium]|nr:MAG: four helix bundle protein [Phycisphaerales bacterium]